MRAFRKSLPVSILMVLAPSVCTFGQAQNKPAVDAAKGQPLKNIPADTITLRRDVNFDQLLARGAGGGKWMDASMEFVPSQNPIPEARDPNFFENVEILLHLAFKGPPAPAGQPPQFDFYSSKVKIAILKAREPMVLHFFIPGYIVERDRLPREPEYWAIEILVDGIAQEPSAKIVSRFYKEQLKFLPTFLTKATQESRKNDGLLMPQFLAPFGIVGQARADTTIPFIREEGRP